MSYGDYLAKQVTKVFEIITPDGEIIEHHESKGSQNGRGWMIMYKRSAAMLSYNKFPPDAYRLFFYIIAHCDWESGLTTTRSSLAKALAISRPTLNKAIDALKDHEIIKESEVNGCTRFYLNPDVSTQGRDRGRRLTEYNYLPAN